MPPWGLDAGGPLRDDQLEDLSAYILNFDKGSRWTLDDLYLVNQFGIVPGAVVPAGGEAMDALRDEAIALAAQIESGTLVGDAESGQGIYTGAAGCVACHTGGIVGPDVIGTWTRVNEERLSDPAFAGYTAEQYVVESIIAPGAHVVEGSANAMPPTFRDQLSDQDIADLVAYLATQ
jgi:mono/diheme cytochrome c family protein